MAKAILSHDGLSAIHRDVILNQGIWDKPWNALGVGIYEGYAVMWVGREVDPVTSGSR